jgi:hypothetical protein
MMDGYLCIDAMIALSQHDMQGLVNIAYRFSVQWRFLFSVPKCMVMVYGDQQGDGLVKLGHETLQKVSTSKHVGTVMVTKSNMDIVEYEKRLTDSRKTMYGFLSLGDRKSPVSPMSAMKVYGSKVLPKLMYSVGVSNISKKAVTMLEDAHWIMAKHIQGLHSRTPNVAVLRSMGWLTIEAHVFIEQLRFIASVIQLHPDNIYKKVLRYTYMQNMLVYQQGHDTSPIRTILETSKKVGLFHKIREALEDGVVFTKGQWKRNIMEAVAKYDKRKWKVTCTLYSDNGMESYRAILPDTYTDVWPWWRYASQNVANVRCCMLLLKLCTGDVPIFDRGSNICKICDRVCDGRKDLHMLFMCDQLKGYLQHLGTMLYKQCLKV